jgi:preprotein translocase subunit SecY
MTEASRSTFQAFLPERRAAMAMVLLVVVMVVGWRIPLPGLNFDRAVYWYQLSSDGAARLSIFALGLVPLFTILVYAEIAKLAVPPLARWQAGSSRNAGRMTIIVSCLSLALAASQGNGVLQGLAAGEILRTDTAGLLFAALACFIGCTALTIWLADDFEFPRLGGGFWPLMAIPTLLDFPRQISGLSTMFSMQMIRGDQLLIVGLSLLAAILLVVFANLLLSRNGHASGVAKTSILLWPPYLASAVAGFVVILLPTEVPDWPFVAPSFFEVAYLATTVIFIPVFVFGYARSFRLSQSDGLRLWPTPVLLATAAIQIILCVGAALLPLIWGLPLSVSGAELLVVGTVMLALRGSQRQVA